MSQHDTKFCFLPNEWCPLLSCRSTCLTTQEMSVFAFLYLSFLLLSLLPLDTNCLLSLLCVPRSYSVSSLFASLIFVQSGLFPIHLHSWTYLRIGPIYMSKIRIFFNRLSQLRLWLPVYMVLFASCTLFLSQVRMKRTGQLQKGSIVFSLIPVSRN